MKTWPFTRLILAASLGLGITWAREPAFLLEVKKETPIFARPNAQSLPLAEAEAGTTLLYLGKSRKGTWVKLRDSDGMVGWVPTDRTDYAEVSAAKQEIDKIEAITRHDPAPSPEEVREEMRSARAPAPSPRPIQLRVAPLMRWLSDREPASPRLGLRVDYNLAPLAPSGTPAGAAWAVAEATFPSPFVKHPHSDFSAALRYAFRTAFYGPTYYGPDFGYSIDKVKSDFRHHFAVGFSTGLALGPLDVGGRVGYDFFAHSRYGFELQLGVTF